MPLKQQLHSGPPSVGIWLALLLAVGSWVRIDAQPHLYAGDRLVEQADPQQRSDAVMITKVSVGPTDVQCGLVIGPNLVQPVSPFRAGDDWLQNMTISLFNRTDKTIVALHLSLGFPDTGDGRTKGQRAYLVQLGRRPDVDSIDGRTGRPIPQAPDLKPLQWEPGQTLDVMLSPYIDDIRGQVEIEMPLSKVSRLSIHVGPLFFADGMRWYLENFANPDPKRPGKFKDLPDDYFPGDKSRNFPPASSR